MVKTAEAFLSGRYNYQERGSSPVVPMVEIAVTDPSGKPLMLLQVEDTPEMIESVLRMEGWGIAERDGDRLKLYALDVREIDAPAPVSLAKEDYSSPRVKKKTFRMGISLALILILTIIVWSGSSSSKNKIASQKQIPEVSAEEKLTIKSECYKELFAKMGTTDAPIVNSTIKTSYPEEWYLQGNSPKPIDTYPGNYRVTGSLDAREDQLGLPGQSFVCDMVFSNKDNKWHAKVSLPGGSFGVSK